MWPGPVLLPRPGLAAEKIFDALDELRQHITAIDVTVDTPMDEDGTHETVPGEGPIHVDMGGRAPASHAGRRFLVWEEPKSVVLAVGVVVRSDLGAVGETPSLPLDRGFGVVSVAERVPLGVVKVGDFAAAVADAPTEMRFVEHPASGAVADDHLLVLVVDDADGDGN